MILIKRKFNKIISFAVAIVLTLTLTPAINVFAASDAPDLGTVTAANGIAHIHVNELRGDSTRSSDSTKAASLVAVSDPGDFSASIDITGQEPPNPADINVPGLTNGVTYKFNVYTTYNGVNSNIATTQDVTPMDSSATPDIPTASAITYGNTLSTSTLPTTAVFNKVTVNGKWTWDAVDNVSATTYIPKVSNSGFSASFKADNDTSANVYSVIVPLTVNRLQLRGYVLAGNKEYDGTTNATGNVSLENAIRTDGVSAAGTGTFADKNVGTNKSVTFGTVELSGADAGNYLPPSGMTSTADISAAQLTITADDKTIHVGQAIPTFTGSVTGFVGGDTQANNVSGVTYTCSATSSSPEGTYPIIASGGTINSNYSPIYVAGTLTIAPIVAPSAPTVVTGAAGDGSAVVSFTPPKDDGGSAITGYKVMNGTAIVGTGTKSPITVTNLTNGKMYSLTVVAINNIGTSALSNAVNVTPSSGSSSGGSSTVSGPNHVLTKTTPADSPVAIDKNIYSTQKNGTVSVTAGSAGSITLSADQMKAMKSKNANLIVKSDNKSLTIPSDSKVLTNPDKTAVSITKKAVTANTSTHFNGIDKSNTILLNNTFSDFKVTSGEKAVDTKGNIAFDLSGVSLTDSQIANLAGVKVDATGKYTLSGGTYDKKTKTFTASVDSLGEYAVVINDVPVPMGAPVIAPKTHVVLTIGQTGFDANGKTMTMDTPPVIKDNTTYVPLRFVAESLGATIDWNADTKTASISLGGQTIKIVSGDGNFIKDGRIMVPIRYISENLGATVNWDGNTKTIDISKK